MGNIAGSMGGAQNVVKRDEAGPEGSNEQVVGKEAGVQRTYTEDLKVLHVRLSFVQQKTKQDMKTEAGRLNVVPACMLPRAVNLFSTATVV
jgi:hypothetical protein